MCILKCFPLCANKKNQCYLRFCAFQNCQCMVHFQCYCVGLFSGQNRLVKLHWGILCTRFLHGSVQCTWQLSCRSHSAR